jgi:hypothetical protein
MIVSAVVDGEGGGGGGRRRVGSIWALRPPTPSPFTRQKGSGDSGRRQPKRVRSPLHRTDGWRPHQKAERRAGGRGAVKTGRKRDVRVGLKRQQQQQKKKR